MNNAIRTEHLVKNFRRVEALRGLNLTVPEGAATGLLARTAQARQPS
jgi:ABC-type multidrug transport system ATPase subunit